MRTIGKGLKPDLRPLEVRQDGDRDPLVSGGPLQVGVDLFVDGVGAVAQIEPGHIHPRSNQGTKLVVGTSGGTKGGDNFGAAHSAPHTEAGLGLPA